MSFNHPNIDRSGRRSGKLPTAHLTGLLSAFAQPVGETVEAVDEVTGHQHVHFAGKVLDQGTFKDSVSSDEIPLAIVPRVGVAQTTDP